MPVAERFFSFLHREPLLRPTRVASRTQLQIPANRRTRSIEDVEHIIILTQENRSFDSYFGTLRGVRGFSDLKAAYDLAGYANARRHACNRYGAWNGGEL